RLLQRSMRRPAFRPAVNCDMGVTMMARSYSDNKALEVLCAFLAVGISSGGDALVKFMSGSYPVHQILFIRCLVGFPILAAIVLRQAPMTALSAPGWQLSLIRGAIMSSAYLAYILSLAAMPMTATVAIYFAMP